MTTTFILQSDLKFGFHISKKPLLEDSFRWHIENDSPLRSYQIYLSSGRAWDPPKVSGDSIRKSGHLLKRMCKYACVHGCLLYNLAGSTDGKSDPRYNQKLSSTLYGLTTELDIASGFGGGVVVHTGVCKETSAGLDTVSKSIEKVLINETPYTKQLSKELSIPVEEIKSSRKVILENCAGEKNKLGKNIDQLKTIIKGVPSNLRDQVKVCIDTAHIFGAGEYDFGDEEEVVKFFDDFDKTIGLEKLELFHLNDSRVPFSSKKDRHENMGIGYIFGKDRENDGTEGLIKLLQECEERNIPVIGEPPAKTKEGLPAPGGIWDYSYIHSVYPLETEFVCD